ncbi:hypothetical protein TrCOL_g11429 [Triparma columacea]|uniref:PITH domain-containing protein n=1 Tax=Triparma columacea TaxID=722753 RepID=A0A9W7GLU6_9STRA|nr:hypothetical protein TrCOL_g11429 [Triparma columacea]
MMATGAAGAEAQPKLDCTTMRDITPLIAKAECYCLNECHDATHENLFIGDDRLALKSDADEQLLIHITFNETVKVSGLKFTAYNTSNLDLQTAPKYVKVFVNRPSMGFTDAEDVEPTEEFEFTEEEISNEKGVEKSVRFVKFQRVSSLSIFVEENFGGETTAIGGLRIHGVPVQGTNMDDLKKCG